MAITTAKLFNGKHIAIASSHYLIQPSPFSFKSDTMLNRLDTVYNNKLNIIIVGDIIEKMEITKLGNSVYSNYTIFQIPFKDFFEKSYLENIFYNKKINQSIFMFYNTDYRTVV